MHRLALAAIAATLALPALADEVPHGLSPALGACSTRTELTGRVIADDGDTLHVIDGGYSGVTLRLFGIDAPEMKNWPHGQRARGVMDGILAEAKAAPLTCRTTGACTYGRWVALCALPDGRDLGLLMVEAGWATAFRRYTWRSYEALGQSRVAKIYDDAEARARAARRGVWGE